MPLVVKERFETTAARFFVHADAGVGDFNPDLAGFTDALIFPPTGIGAQHDLATIGHRIDGIKDEVGDGFAQFAGVAKNFGKLGVEIGFDLDNDAAFLRDVAPARARQVDDFLCQFVELDREEDVVGFAFAVELAHARDNMRDVFASGADAVQVTLYVSGGWLPRCNISE